MEWIAGLDKISALLNLRKKILLQRGTREFVNAHRVQDTECYGYDPNEELFKGVDLERALERSLHGLRQEITSWITDAIKIRLLSQQK